MNRIFPLPVVTILVVLMSGLSPIWLLAADDGPAEAGRVSWSLTYNVHGGFAGLRQDLSLNHHGELKVTNEKDYKVIYRLLPERRMKELTALLDSLRKVKPEAISNNLCRDCIRHDLSFTFAGDTFEYHYQTGDTLSNELDAVLSYLGQYLQKGDSPM